MSGIQSDKLGIDLLTSVSHNTGQAKLYSVNNRDSYVRRTLLNYLNKCLFTKH